MSSILCSSCQKTNNPLKQSTYKTIALLFTVTFGCLFFSLLGGASNHFFVGFVKALPAQSLAMIVYMFSAKNMLANYTMAAFLFCAIGDFMLYIEEHPKIGGIHFFLFGLISFLFAHCLLIFGMYQRIEELKVPGKDSFIKAFVFVFMFVVLANVLPNIGDPILTMGCFVYSVVIAYMMYCALYLASQESKYLTKVESDLKEFESRNKNNSKESEYLFSVKYDFKGDLMGIQTYTLAAIVFAISDSILSYSKFVDKIDRRVSIMFTYYAALYLFAIASMRRQPCLSCYGKCLKHFDLGKSQESNERDKKKIKTK